MTGVVDEPQTDDAILHEDAELARTEADVAPQQAFRPCNRTDLGNAKRLCKCFGDELRYCPAWRRWLFWDGQRWQVDETGQAMRYAKETVVSILEEASRVANDDLRTKLRSWEEQSESAPRLRALLSVAETEEKIPVTPKQLDANPWYLNVRNGTVDLRTGEVLGANTGDLITKLTGGKCHGDRSARPTQWLEFLDQIFDGDAELISFVQQAVGYSLTGITREQCFFVLWGTGQNGKSTFLETIRAVLGEYAMSTDFSTFLSQRTGSIRNDIARLAGARFVTACEAEANRQLSEAVVKQLTGSDEVLARFLHREFFAFKPQFKLWLAANHKPTIQGTDNAIWRRVHLIWFPVTIPDEDQDKNLDDKLRAEMPGILQWAIDGCLTWQEAGALKPPTAVKKATAEYRTEMDILGSFLDEQCITSQGTSAKTKDLYAAYQTWCVKGGESHITKIMFGRSLTERGFTKGRGTGGDIVYRGLNLREPTLVSYE